MTTIQKILLKNALRLVIGGALNDQHDIDEVINTLQEFVDDYIGKYSEIKKHKKI